MAWIARDEKGSNLTPAEGDDLFAQKYTQATHGLTDNQAVYRNGSGAWVAAIATAESTLADGIVVFVEDTNTVRVLVARQIVPSAAHGFTLGAKLYLSQSVAGQLTTTQPTAGWIQRVGKVTTAGEFLWSPQTNRDSGEFE